MMNDAIVAESIARASLEIDFSRAYWIETETPSAEARGYLLLAMVSVRFHGGFAGWGLSRRVTQRNCS